MKKLLLLLLATSLFIAAYPAFSHVEAAIAWTDDEATFIAAHPIILMGVDPEFVPFEFIEGGEYKGIASDYVALIESSTGIDFQVVPDLTWSEAYFEALAGNIDVLPAVSKTPAREEFFLFSDMYYEVRRVIVTLNDNTSIKGITDLYGTTVAVQTNSSHHSFLLQYPEINLSLYDTVGDALAAVSSGGETAFVGNLATSDYLIKSIGLTNLRFTALSSTDPVGLHFAVRQDWPLLVSILDKALSAITPEQKIAINARWITVDTETDYGPIIQIIVIVTSIVILVSAVSVVWVLRLKKEIAARKRTQDDLEKAKREAEEANAVKSSFMARMSHEIRTPLNAITGMSYLLKKTDISPTQRMYADRITQASTTMLSLINDILDYSKIEAGKISLELLPFNLDSVIQNVISIISVKIEEKGLGFKLNKDPSLPSWFIGDSKRIEQVLLNLLNNAVKFTATGEVSLEIRLVAKQGLRHRMTIAVKDTGIGMSETAIKGLFVPFVQADSSINRRYGGTGLGLSIVKNLIEMMGGTIEVYSTENEGSTFVVSLELPVDADKEKEYKDEGSGLYFQNIRTLVLEKTAANLNIIDSYLRSYGMSCELTTSPTAAVSLLESASARSAQPFDLIILDYDAPPENGYAFLAALRENHKIPKKPKVILLLPMLRSDLFDKLTENGVDVGIGKPIIPSVLHNGVMEIFAHKAIAASESFDETKSAGGQIEKVHLTVLVVDDNTTNQLIAKLLLEQSGFDVLIAGDGAEGVSQFEKNAGKIAVILMDLHMPVMNGYDAADKIRIIAPDLPIVAMTAEVIPGVREKCEAHGIRHYISKPFDPERFVGTIRGILKSSGVKVAYVSKSINRSRGLHNLGDNPEMYRLVLREYLKENQETAPRLEAAIREHRYEDARQIVHKVKGSSGSIGAEELYKVAVTLQKALEANDESIVAAESQAFVNLLREVLSEIDKDGADPRADAGPAKG